MASETNHSQHQCSVVDSGAVGSPTRQRQEEHMGRQSLSSILCLPPHTPDTPVPIGCSIPSDAGHATRLPTPGTLRLLETGLPCKRYPQHAPLGIAAAPFFDHHLSLPLRPARTLSGPPLTHGRSMRAPDITDADIPMEDIAFINQPEQQRQRSSVCYPSPQGSQPQWVSPCVSQYQIVLIKPGQLTVRKVSPEHDVEETRIVLFNLQDKRLEARALTPLEENAIRAHRLSHCPMCGQVLDPTRFSFQAQTYFRILQDMLRARFSSFTTPPTEYTGTDITPPYSEDLTAVPPFLSQLPCEGQDPNENPFLVNRSPTRTATTNHSNNGNHFAPSVSASRANGDTIPIPKNLSKEIFNTGYYKQFFREIRRLGSGSFGQVYLCHHSLDDVYLGEYAVKKVPVGDDKAWLQKMLREVKIRERLHNANIVEYKHSWLEMHRTNHLLPIIPWLFVLMEFCNGGDLETFLFLNRFTRSVPDSTTLATPNPPLGERERVEPINESFIWKLFFDIANGLNHLHHSGILHRDLKPQNILLQCTLDTQSQQLSTNALLADFGTSELVTERVRRFQRQGYTGTVEFTAPELLETDETGALRDDYDEKSDLWSLGVVLYVLAYGRVPYSNEDPKSVRLDILGHTDPHRIIPEVPNRSTDLILLIEALLQRDPANRPTLDRVLSHRRIFKRLTDTEALAEASRQISYLLPLHRPAHRDKECDPFRRPFNHAYQPLSSATSYEEGEGLSETTPTSQRL